MSDREVLLTSMGPLPKAPSEPCGCDKRGDRTFLCTYHQGVEDERAKIVAWLREDSYGSALEYAERIEKGEHHE